jgi:superfamily II DNA or RNA helicase
VAFCVSIDHAQHVAQEFSAAGYRAVAISGDSDQAERDAALIGLQSGALDVVCNCALWVAGVDAPAVSCIILLAPTQSLTKYLQSIGRGLRTHPGKDDCIILDHAGNIERHGSPIIAREWSLAGAGGKGKKGPQEMAVKTCPDCFATVMSQATDCICGHHFEPKPRELNEVDGTLSEIDLTKAVMEQQQAQKKPRPKQSLPELEAIARSRGYKRPAMWARAVLMGRIKFEERQA